MTEDADLGLRLARADIAPRADRYRDRGRGLASPRAWVLQSTNALVEGLNLTWSAFPRSAGTVARSGARALPGLSPAVRGSLLQFLLAPVLWSFWLVLLAMPHPLSPVLGEGGFRLIVGAVSGL